MPAPGLVELHFHLLPGVDDGPQSLSESVELLKMAHDEGVRHVVATPHMYLPPFDNFDPTPILRAFDELREEIAELSQRLGFLREIRLSLGAENFVSPALFEALETRDLITLNGGDHVLLDFSSSTTHDQIHGTVEKVKAHGLNPVLAHVERYPVFQSDWRRLEALAQTGCLLQINAASLLGLEGRRTRRFCDRLLKRNLVQLVASDAHDSRSRAPALGRAYRALAERFSNEDALLLTRDNARVLLEPDPRSPSTSSGH